MLLHVQCCPESIMTKVRKDLVKNFLEQGANSD
jgi:anthranilate/para-aminobenzoate synthase component II